MFRKLLRIALVVMATVGSLVMPGCSNQPSLSRPDGKTQKAGTGGKAKALPQEMSRTQEAAVGSKTQSLPGEIAVDLGGGVKLELVLIPAGDFVMGTPDERRVTQMQHRVRITKQFHLGKYQVTQEQWEAIMGNNPSNFKGPRNPVEKVSWNDCQQFLAKLNEKFKVQAGRFQLPTEAQWEYACRAGSTTRYRFGDDKSELDEYAWYSLNSDRTTHPVGEKKRNAWGLYDMHGNLWEWCQDWYDDEYYANSAIDDPTGPAIGTGRVGRGGSWSFPADGCRSAFRFIFSPELRHDALGFRVSLVPSE